jgi:hypothetical protein
MKYFIISCLSLFCLTANAQHTVEKLWATDTIIDLPESVLPDAKAGVVYTSIMGKDYKAKDGIGGIGKLDPDGKVINLEWITGLNAPKGMAIHGHKMYVADVTDVVVIDIAKSKVDLKIPITGAIFLNDITVSDKGVVYVSDSETKRIHKLVDNKESVYLENIEGVNGLKAIGDHLYIAAGKNLLNADAKKKMIKVAGLPNGGDGIEPIGNGDFLFSSWGGQLYYVYADGKYDTLLDTSADKINCADIGYDPVKKIIYVPTFFKKGVVAYQLK